MALSQAIKVYGTASALVASIGGGVYVVEDRYAHKAETIEVKEQVAELDGDIQQHVLEEQIDKKEERIWKYEDRLEKKPNDQEAKARIRELKAEQHHLEKELEQLKK